MDRSGHFFARFGRFGFLGSKKKQLQNLKIIVVAKSLRDECSTPKRHRVYTCGMDIMSFVKKVVCFSDGKNNIKYFYYDQNLAEMASTGGL